MEMWTKTEKEITGRIIDQGSWKCSRTTDWENFQKDMFGN